MLVKERMTRDPITANRNDGLGEINHIMQENSIRHIPVLSEGKLVGMITNTDVMRALPSKVSTLERREATYLLGKVKVKDAMPEKQKLITINENACIEEAALLMRSYKIGALPVLDDNGALVGICTETNIFDAFIDMVGVRSSGSRIEVRVKNQPGELANMAEVISSFNANITKIAMFPSDDGTDYRVLLRIKIDNTGPIVEALRVHGFEVKITADYNKVYSHLL